MKYEQEVRDVLINNTIQLIAQGGFEKATTKAITHGGEQLPGIKMNEVYIYRLFGSKESLYSVAFSSLDQEIIVALRKCFRSHQGFEDATRERLHRIFCDAWHFILGNEDHCRCYIRYYYSVYFHGETLKAHNRLFNEIILGISPLFKDEADVKSIMHSVFTTLLDFAVRIYNGDLENTKVNEDHIFNVLYCMMVTYFKDEKVSEPHESQFIYEREHYL